MRVLDQKNTEDGLGGGHRCSNREIRRLEFYDSRRSIESRNAKRRGHTDAASTRSLRH